MNIWIDVYHIPQLNFYLPLIHQLSMNGHQVYLTALNRGKLLNITHKELDNVSGVSIHKIGNHRMKRWSAIIEANLIRLPWAVLWAVGKRIDVGFTNGWHSCVAGKLLGFPVYTFNDDPQGPNYKYIMQFTTKNNCLIGSDLSAYHLPKGDNALSCLKEWAYLNPRTFKPNVKVLEKYGVQPKQYIFLREVSVGTVNYADQAPQAILAVAGKIEEERGKREEVRGKIDFKVLFSLEEKNRRSEYPVDWILLQEPIEDIHSLMYYAAGLVSSGDSMAREAALLGIPAYYLGVRHSMPANLAASKVANLQNETTQPFESWLRDLAQPKGLIEGKIVEKIGDKIEGEIEATSLSPEQQSAKRVEYLSKQQDSLRQKIDSDFIDINAYMLSLVNQA